mmetsp:Transcript_26893/g.48601  ORF Transcript_26893/g.48601 Transcript_26893/m.48601 type:complete len:301 (-) Transcript_26893:62-964(-)
MEDDWEFGGPEQGPYGAGQQETGQPYSQAGMKCGRGHALQLSSCSMGCQLCDRCERRIDTTFTYRCRACDYDLCERCFAAAKQVARARTQEAATSLAETQAAAKAAAAKAAAMSTSPRERLEAAISANSPGSWAPPSLSARERRPSWNHWNLELPGRVLVSRPRTPRKNGGPRSPFLGPGNTKSLPQPRQVKPARRPASNAPSPLPAAEAQPAPDQNESYMATQVGQALQGDAVDIDFALQGLPASDRFRLAAAMVVVRQMTNPHAPKVDPRRDNGPDRGSTWAAITSGEGPRYWTDMNT